MSGGKFEIDIHGMCAMQANAATNRKKKNLSAKVSATAWYRSIF